jgi:glycosyltransferase involved in cell wall biosynthesis
VENRKRVHTLYVLTKLELGGAQKVCLSLLKGLQEKGIESSLISGPEGVLVSEAKKSSSVYLINSFRREVGFKSIFLEIKTFVCMILLMRKIKKNNSSLIVHTHSTKAGIFGRWAAFFAGVKKRVHTVHGFGFHKYQSKIGWVVNYIFEFLASFVTTHYVCVSDEDRKTGRRLIPNFLKKSSIIRAAVDWDRFYQPAILYKEKSNDEKQFIFGTVSCFKPQKNLLDLLKAFKLFRDKLMNKQKENVLLQIVGDGILRKEIEQWIHENKMKEYINLLGWQSDVAPFLRNWNVFTMSSLWEGLPCAVVEARLSRLPVISYSIGGIPEVIKDGINGFLVKPGNWKKFSERMGQLYNNYQLYSDMRQLQEDLSDFRDQSMIDNHINLYNRII